MYCSVKWRGCGAAGSVEVVLRRVAPARAGLRITIRIRSRRIEVLLAGGRSRVRRSAVGRKIVRSKHRSSVNAHQHVTTTSRLRSDPQAPQGPLSPLLLLLLNTTRTDPTSIFSRPQAHGGRFRMDGGVDDTTCYTQAVNRQKVGERRSLSASSYADRHFA